MRAILWDMDDTLLNTLPSRMLALAHAYETCVGGTTDPLELWRSHSGGTLEAMGERLLGGDGAQFVGAYRDFYYANHRHIDPFPGIETVLERYLQAGVPMAVVTSKIGYGAVDELERSGLLQYFQAVVGFDDTDLHKPDPEPIFAAMDRIMVTETSGVVFVGDSPADVLAAKNAGARSVAALWGSLDSAALLAASPDGVAQAPVDVPTTIVALREVPA